MIELKGGYLRSEAAKKLVQVHRKSKVEGSRFELVIVTNVPGRVQHRKGDIVEWCGRYGIPCYIMDGYLPEWMFENAEREPCEWETSG